MTAPSSEFNLSCVDGWHEDREDQALGTSCSILNPIPFVLFGHGNSRKIKDRRTEMAVTGFARGALQTDQPLIIGGITSACGWIKPAVLPFPSYLAVDSWLEEYDLAQILLAFCKHKM